MLSFQDIFYKVRFALAIIALIIITGVIFKNCSGCTSKDPPSANPKESNVPRISLPKRENEITILDKDKKLIQLKYNNSKNVEKIISISHPPDSAGTIPNPTTLIVEKSPSGFFPEIFKASPIKISSLEKDSTVTILDFEDKIFDFEYNPLIGASYSKIGIEWSLGMSLARITFIHVSTSISGQKLEDIDLNVGARIEFVENIYLGYDYGIISTNNKISLQYCYKF